MGSIWFLLGKTALNNLKCSWLMITKTKTGSALMATVFALILSPIVSNDAEARTVTTIIAPDEVEVRISTPTMILQGDLTAPSGDKPFGGETVGSYYSHVTGDFTTVYVQVNIQASPDTVFEGWLVDADTGEKTSFGIFQDYRGNKLLASFENQFNNDLIVSTEEPRKDSDPAPNTPVGGAVLGNPFGQ